MVLSGLQSLSLLLFGWLGRLLTKDSFKLKRQLVQARIPLLPAGYVAHAAMQVFATFIAGLALVFAFIAVGVPFLAQMTGPNGEPIIVSEFIQAILALVLIIVLPLLIAMVNWLEPGMRIGSRAKDMDRKLPFAASYTAAMAAANSTPDKIFKSLAQNEHIYGDIAYDSSMIYRDIQLLGMDLVTALKLAVQRAASPWVTEFFQGMVGTLTSGGNLKLYFLNRAEHYMRENRVRLHIFLESLSMMAESYVVVAVAMPLFLIVMLVIMFWVSGSGAQLSEEMVYGVVMGVLPVIHIAYGILVWMMSDEMKM